MLATIALPPYREPQSSKIYCHFISIPHSGATDIEIDTEPGLDTEDNSDNVTLPDGFTYSFRDPDNADGIVVTPRE